jgi:hypothetical protein
MSMSDWIMRNGVSGSPDRLDRYQAVLLTERGDGRQIRGGLAGAKAVAAVENGSLEQDDRLAHSVGVDVGNKLDELGGPERRKQIR